MTKSRINLLVFLPNLQRTSLLLQKPIITMPDETRITRSIVIFGFMVCTALTIAVGMYFIDSMTEINPGQRQLLTELIAKRPGDKVIEGYLFDANKNGVISVSEFDYITYINNDSGRLLI